MTLHFACAGHQIIGQREQQEDAFRIAPLSGDAAESPRLLAVLADGMGGHAGGKVAANLVVDAFVEHFREHDIGLAIPEQLHQALLHANQRLGEGVKAKPHLEGMGCTLVAVLVEESRLWWISVGDSHLYLFRNGSLGHHNADHSFGGYLDQLKAAGKPLPARQDLPRNMLMSAVVGGELSLVDLPQEPLELTPGDRILLASDGLNTITSDEIGRRLEGDESPLQHALNLVTAVEEVEKPRQDNTTVVVVQCFDPASLTVPEVPPLPTTPEPRRSLPTAAIAGGVVLLLALLGGAGYYFLFLRASPSTPAATYTPPPPAIAEAPAAKPEGETAAETVEPPPRERRPFRDPLATGGSGPEMLELLGGSFRMGSLQLLMAPDEQPDHEVTVAPFAIARYETTLAEYALFAEAEGRLMPPNDGLDPETYPVVLVSWEEAVAYTRWLSRQTGHRYRLPSEAEWEYAARAGTETPYWWGPAVGKDNARCFDCGSRLRPSGPAPVGSFAANPFQLFDTSGNVGEWVQDCYHSHYRGAPTDGGAWESAGCGERVVRGGSFANVSSSLRNAKRHHLPPEHGVDNVGFRVVRELD